MEKLHSHNVLSPFFLLLLLHLSSLQLLSSAYTPPLKYFINCGSKSNMNLSNRNFVGDENSGTFSFSKKSSTETDNSPTRNPSALYHTARIFNRQSSYKFTIDETGTYLVRLHFYPFSSHTNLTTAVFNVSIQGFSLLSNFSVRNSTNTPVIKEFLITINPKKFIIQFTPYQRTSLAFINALEVFVAPPKFIPDAAPHVTPGGKANLTSGGLPSQALKTLYRINVGGDSFGSDYDTLWRNWTSDDGYLINQESTTNKLPPKGIKYEDGNATKYIAPNFVYNTARVLNVKSNISNITWRFDVSKKASHLVRIHFCDIESESQNTLVFNLYIYSKFIQIVNPYEIFNPVAAPFCLDFVVDSDESGFMNISVGTMLDSDNPPILNGLEILEFMKESNSAFVEEESKKNHLSLIVGLAAGGVVIVSILMIVVLALRCRKTSDSNVPKMNLGLKIPFAQIKRATKNFDKKKMIGSGGFGNVYLGTLRNGMKVAVKRGEAGHQQGFSEFQTEIKILSKIRHRHLVSLIGYCDERSEMILVYEFMEKGTLRDHLYNSSKNSAAPSTEYSLSWKQRLEICIGSAEGLNYLHTSSDGGIIHRDVKSTNILLDGNCVAKVADFGISRTGHLDETHVTTDVKGSFGYFDPEYYGSQMLTLKSDVYSFGVVLLEVLCARPPIDTSLPGKEVNLAEWAMSWQKRGQLEKVIDPRLVGDINPSSLRKFGEIAENCLKECGADRPTMGDVMWDLKYALELQQSITSTEPFEDSTIDASLQLPLIVTQSLPSHSFSIEKDDVPTERNDGSETTASEVFSQLRIDDPR
ncbi:probable receptor-like protein kinase At5g24010 [Cornus florida]|uniref:probable receptor-like protein kinase At5g24010 n=1 Tax=Cornus florida TaxID=4283 RepID=UPI00289A9DD2|nr:probable receptor-like protein kinase At5g24010 [Cornus florida]XP_059643447.1 probable receptor-like protein kinase At5g24010 [Cornus florida]XP_059643448.1 probable receptor-like protein kinase At5g24010 [Cornus florida]